MTIFIGFEELVANALINEIETKGRGNISFRDAYYYATKVAIKLQREGHAVAVMREGFGNITPNNLFKVDIGLQRLQKYPSVKVEQLKEKYRAPLTEEVLEACIAIENSLKKEAEGEG